MLNLGPLWLLREGPGERGPEAKGRSSSSPGWCSVVLSRLSLLDSPLEVVALFGVRIFPYHSNESQQQVEKHRHLPAKCLGMCVPTRDPDAVLLRSFHFRNLPRLKNSAIRFLLRSFSRGRPSLAPHCRSSRRGPAPHPHTAIDLEEKHFNRDVPVCHLLCS